MGRDVQYISMYSKLADVEVAIALPNSDFESAQQGTTVYSDSLECSFRFPELCPLCQGETSLHGLETEGYKVDMIQRPSTHNLAMSCPAADMHLFHVSNHVCYNTNNVCVGACNAEFGKGSLYYP